jgi:hypothetical protein
MRTLLILSINKGKAYGYLYFPLGDNFFERSLVPF